MSTGETTAVIIRELGSATLGIVREIKDPLYVVLLLFCGLFMILLFLNNRAEKKEKCILVQTIVPQIQNNISVLTDEIHGFSQTLLEVLIIMQVTLDTNKPMITRRLKGNDDNETKRRDSEEDGQV